MYRLFVALRPAPEQRDALLAIMHGVANARWQDDAQLHVTLRFIGEVDGRTADDIAIALAAVRHPPIDLALAGGGSFEHKGRADTLWVAAHPRGTLAALHRKVDNAVIRTGLPAEVRAYRPHITLARFNRSAGPVASFLAESATFTTPTVQIDAFHLCESRLGTAGARYTIVETYPLA